MSWDEIGARYETDKSTVGPRQSAGHGYLDGYEHFLAGRPIRSVLEIGVDQGASMAFWAEALPDAAIVGVDILPDCSRFATPQVTIAIADVSKPEQLTGLANLSFDLIIDDGSHGLADIRSALTFFVPQLNVFVPQLNEGGFYIVEDVILGPSRWPASIYDVLPLTQEHGLSLVAVIGSRIPFVQGNEHYGDFCSVITRRVTRDDPRQAFGGRP